ncbi:MAG: tRNA (adenosine(37)-N6)-threonylcarbamoyltransferase complex dimerization subunit type 1 TsaB [Elusimicrobia bacterium]|nr:tRNA (adenosine(37)-N6)-threonylcarbamoyltransferase complex dimerization subunit type 1 TsaB [Elusimicrobiota bacterium]
MYLAIDTTTSCFSMAILDPRKNIIREIFIKQDNTNRAGRPETVVRSFDKLLKKINPPASPSDIKKIFVTTGPGSFTGIRVGLSFARTISHLLNIPVVGIPTLELLAYQISGDITVRRGLAAEAPAEIVCPLVPASSNKFHYALYEISKGKIKRISPYFTATTGALNFAKFSFPRASALLKYASGKNGVSYQKIKPLYIKPPKIHSK